MRGTAERLFREIAAPDTPGLFHVRRWPGNPAYYVARDHFGRAAVLVSASGEGRVVPLQLAGIEARFSMLCSVAEPGSPSGVETLTAILCVSGDASTEAYFASVIESLVQVLGPAPTTVDVAIAVDRLVELFQKLRMPARRSLAGLVGELCVILEAESAVAAVAGWRKDADERYDFVVGNLRLDAKSSADKRRVHAVSFDQANPPPGTLGLLGSVFVTGASGGASLSALVALVEGRLGLDQAMVTKLRTIVADSLGETLPQAMDWHFDLALAKSSLEFYDVANIPAIRPPLPLGVSGLRFVSSLEQSLFENVRTLRKRLEPGEAALLPIPSV